MVVVPGCAGVAEQLHGVVGVVVLCGFVVSLINRFRCLLLSDCRDKAVSSNHPKASIVPRDATGL